MKFLMKFLLEMCQWDYKYDRHVIWKSNKCFFRFLFTNTITECIRTWLKLRNWFRWKISRNLNKWFFMNFSIRFRLDVAYTIKIGNIYFDLMGDVIIDIILASFIPFVIVLQLCSLSLILASLPLVLTSHWSRLWNSSIANRSLFLFLRKISHS